MHETRIEFLLSVLLTLAWFTLWALWYGQIILEAHAQVTMIMQEIKGREKLIDQLARSLSS